jgi:hypothetical protein
MPGENCSVYDEQKAWVYLSYPPRKTNSTRNGEEDWLGQILPTRVVDKSFRMQIKEDSVYTCEKHFRPEDIETCK